jgi:hypothetical protein
MTADNASTFVGVSPTLTYQLTGLLGADTPSTAISNVAINYSSNLLTTPSITTNALVPAAISSNYSLSFVSGQLTVVDDYQMIINPGSNSTSYGIVNSGNVAYLGNALATNHGVSAGYCTNCRTNETPNIINLTITAPTAGSSVWLAEDSLGVGSDQGRYTFTIDVSTNVNDFNAGGSLKVANYVLTPDNLETVAGYTTRYSTVKPIIYNLGSLSVTPKALTVTGTTVDHKTYDGTNAAHVTNGQLAGVIETDRAYLGLTQSGTFASVNAANGIAVNIAGTLTGSAAANYVLTQPTGLTANIAPAQVMIGGLSVANKVYDASTAGTISGTPIVLGLIGSDTANASGSVTGAFVQTNVGNNLLVSANLSSLQLDNPNYVIAGVSGALTANITPARITVTAAKT